MIDNRCIEKFWKADGNWGHTVRCGRCGTVAYGNDLYCWQHDPDRVKKQRILKEEQARKERELSSSTEAEGLKLLTLLGVDGKVGYSSKLFRYTEEIVISFGEAKKLIELIDEHDRIALALDECWPVVFNQTVG